MNNFEAEFLDKCYKEMMDYSGLDTGLIHDILNAAEEDEIAFEIVVRWMAAQSSKEVQLCEAMMSEFLQLGL